MLRPTGLRISLRQQGTRCAPALFPSLSGIRLRQTWVVSGYYLTPLRGPVWQALRTARLFPAGP